MDVRGVCVMGGVDSSGRRSGFWLRVKEVSVTSEDSSLWKTVHDETGLTAFTQELFVAASFELIRCFFFFFFRGI